MHRSISKWTDKNLEGTTATSHSNKQAGRNSVERIRFGWRHIPDLEEIEGSRATGACIAAGMMLHSHEQHGQAVKIEAQIHSSCRLQIFMVIKDLSSAVSTLFKNGQAAEKGFARPSPLVQGPGC